MSRETRALLVVMLIFGIGALGYRFLFGGGMADRFHVETVAGNVQHLHASGEAGAAQAGDTLEEGDRIVSGDGGRAVLGLGADTRVTVDASTSVKVLGVVDDGVRLELEGGRVTATVRPGSGRLGIVSDGREVSAEDADFTAVRDADGTLAVSAERGVLAVSGVEGINAMNAGDDLVSPGDGGSPLRAPASDALLLQVAWPAAGRTREGEVVVEGTTQPGATVSVTGGARPVAVKAGKDGRFSARVPLSEGRNALSVTGSSLLGRSAQVASAELVRDTTAPSVGVTLEF